MANNRIVIICNKCSPKKWVYHTPGVFVLAKYYPNTGYYTANGFSEEKLNDWFDSHRHAKKLNYKDFITRQPATYSPDHLFRMEYEVEAAKVKK